jgi:hypothetical protein
MKKLSVFQLSIKNVVLRFYLMVAVVALFGMIGQWEIAAIAGFITGVSAILGVSYSEERKQRIERSMLRPVEGGKRMRKAG